MKSEFSEKIAVITGGGSGLGAAMGRIFAEAGMAVALLDIDEAAAKQVANELQEGFDVPTTSAKVDVGDAASILDAATHVETTLGGCDFLCANVGVQQFGAIERLTDDDWQWVLNVNVLGTVRTVRAFLPQIRSRDGRRRIVLTASSSVLTPGVRMGAYQTSKFAVLGFGESLREELEGEGIGVTILFPAGMMTTHLVSSKAARPTDLTTTGAEDDDISAMLEHQPLQDGDVVSAEHAVRNLLADLRDEQPYIVTHGSLRSAYEQRRDAIDTAISRMETS